MPKRQSRFTRSTMPTDLPPDYVPKPINDPNDPRDPNTPGSTPAYPPAPGEDFARRADRHAPARARRRRAGTGRDVVDPPGWSEPPIMPGGTPAEIPHPRVRRHSEPSRQPASISIGKIRKHQRHGIERLKVIAWAWKARTTRSLPRPGGRVGWGSARHGRNCPAPAARRLDVMRAEPMDFLGAVVDGPVTGPFRRSVRG